MNQNDTYLYVYGSFIHKEKKNIVKKYSDYLAQPIPSRKDSK